MEQGDDKSPEEFPMLSKSQQPKRQTRTTPTKAKNAAGFAGQQALKEIMEGEDANDGEKAKRPQRTQTEGNARSSSSTDHANMPGNGTVSDQSVLTPLQLPLPHSRRICGFWARGNCRHADTCRHLHTHAPSDQTVQPAGTQQPVESPEDHSN